MLLLLATLALAADEPCYGHLHEDRVQSEHFWVEWDPSVADQAIAEERLQWAEEARQAYLDLGWPLTEEAMVIQIVPGDFSSGLAETEACGDIDVPLITLSAPSKEAVPGHTTTAHEVAHAVQYAYMGNYLHGVNTWVWFMEGSATWLATYPAESLSSWAWYSDRFLAHSHLSLHQDLTAYLFDDRRQHMYGSAFLAMYVDQRYGHRAMQDLWAWGGAYAGGDAIWFPDAVQGVGLSWAPFWQEFLARSAVADLEGAQMLESGALSEEIDGLPASAEVDDDDGPQALGFDVVRFPAALSQRGQALQVTFDGDPEADWHVVLVETAGGGPDGTVLSYAPLAVVDGHGEGWLSPTARPSDAYLVVSPESRDEGSFGYGWSAERVKDEGPMDGTVVLVEPEARACGCTTGGGGTGWLLLGLVPLVVRRRR